jgi:hypothetical protein
MDDYNKWRFKNFINGFIDMVVYAIHLAMMYGLLYLLLESLKH